MIKSNKKNNKFHEKYKNELKSSTCIEFNLNKFLKNNLKENNFFLLKCKTNLLSLINLKIFFLVFNSKIEL